MAPFYAYLPTRLADSKLKYAVMRNALYADPLIPYLAELIARKHLIYPVGDQALSFISQADSAEAFAIVATTPALRDHGRHFLLSQPNTFTMPELGGHYDPSYRAFNRLRPRDHCRICPNLRCGR